MKLDERPSPEARSVAKKLSPFSLAMMQTGQTDIESLVSVARKSQK
jgi:hypothetical protein